MAPANIHSDRIYNASSELGFFFSCTCTAVKFFPIPFAFWYVIYYVDPLRRNLNVTSITVNSSQTGLAVVQ